MDEMLFNTILERIQKKSKENSIAKIDLDYWINVLYDLENSIDTAIQNNK